MCRALLVANNPTPLTFRVMSVYFGQKLIFWFLQIHFVILRNTCFQFTSFRMLSVAHSGSSGSWSPCNFDQEPLQSVSNYTYFNLHKSVLQFREILVLNLKKYTVVAKIPPLPFRMLSVTHSGSSGSWSPCNLLQQPLHVWSSRKIHKLGFSQTCKACNLADVQIFKNWKYILKVTRRRKQIFSHPQSFQMKSWLAKKKWACRKIAVDINLHLTNADCVLISFYLQIDWTCNKSNLIRLNLYQSNLLLL